MEEQNDKIVCIKSYAKRLKLSWLCANAAEMLLEAGSNAPSYDDFICNLLVHEVQGREERQRLKRLKKRRAYRCLMTLTNMTIACLTVSLKRNSIN